MSLDVQGKVSHFSVNFIDKIHCVHQKGSLVSVVYKQIFFIKI